MRKSFNAVLIFYLKNMIFYNIDVTVPDRPNYYQKRYIVSKESNEIQKPSISKIIRYLLDQCDVIRINTAIWDQT